MMNKKAFRPGLRTLKTVGAVLVAMVIAKALGTTDSRLIFAMLGATAAMQPTYRESVDACKTQIIGVLLGAAAGVLLRILLLPGIMLAGLGIALVIIVNNAMGFKFSPSLPIFVVVMICITPDVSPLAYAAGRCWDSAIGLMVGLAVNVLVFPYDNSRQIRSTIMSLDRELIVFLGELFDGDGQKPDAGIARHKIDDMARQLEVFSNQKFVRHAGQQKAQLEAFLLCEDKARLLVAHMEVLNAMKKTGCLNDENQRALEALGAKISVQPRERCEQELYTVTNFHVRRVLALRGELLNVLDSIDKP